MGSRTWIKIYCDKWLSGTLRDEEPEIRSVWIDLLALAGSGRYGDTGEIKIMNDITLTDQQIAGILRIPLELWLKAKARFITTDRITVALDNAIAISNWTKYQSEYERQKVFRSDNPELQPKVTTESAEEIEKGEGRGENREKNRDLLIRVIYKETKRYLGHEPSLYFLGRLRLRSTENLAEIKEKLVKR